jgi:enterochelin esterase-like enzyme
MKVIKRFQVRGIPDQVTRADFAGRTVDFWAPEGGSDSVLIAHDGQNIFDPRTATHLRQTWRLAQNAIRVAKENDKKPPLIIAVFHSSNKQDPYGRIKDLSPEDAIRSGVKPINPISTLDISELRGNEYLNQIFNEILPNVAKSTSTVVSPNNTAMVGSSMGGLATLYAAAKFSNYFNTALAFSPHWVLAGNPLVEYLVQNLPQHPKRKLWMSRGTKGLDASYQPFQDWADELARKKGWHSNFVTKVYHRTGHNERSWSKYVDDALRFWLS